MGNVTAAHTQTRTGLLCYAPPELTDATRIEADDQHGRSLVQIGLVRASGSFLFGRNERNSWNDTTACERSSQRVVCQRPSARRSAVAHRLLVLLAFSFLFCLRSKRGYEPGGRRFESCRARHLLAVVYGPIRNGCVPPL